MTARDRILSKLRSALGDSKTAARKEVATIRVKSRRQHSVTPSIAQTDGRERVARFVAEVEAVQGSVARLADISALPNALAADLRRRNQALSIRIGDDPIFADLDYGVIEISVGSGRRVEPATLTRAISASAETGTVVMASGKDNPVTLNFLAETHYVVVRASDIEAGLEDVWETIRAKGIDPRTINLLTGPSRTGDIEQKIELGAHGPIAMHIFLIEDI